MLKKVNNFVNEYVCIKGKSRLCFQQDTYLTFVPPIKLIKLIDQ